MKLIKPFKVFGPQNLCGLNYLQEVTTLLTKCVHSVHTHRKQGEIIYNDVGLFVQACWA
jgi:hypothetical protein